MNARTLPLITALQMGQWRRLAAQSPHTTKWPQGMKTMDTSLSMHTLQVLSSCSCLSSSSGLGSFTVGETTNRKFRWGNSHYVGAKCRVYRIEQSYVSNYWLWKVLQAQMFSYKSYRCCPLTFLSDGCLCPHISSTGALPRLWLWRTQTWIETEWEGVKHITNLWHPL